MKSELRLYPDLGTLSQAVAVLFIKTAASAIKARGRCLVAISGGGTPLGTYTLLASPELRVQVDWPGVFLFWADERCVPPSASGSNYGQAYQALLRHVPIPKENLLRVRGELPSQQAAEDYAKILASFTRSPRRWPRLDLALLGLGEDGHTASLFPGSPVEAREPVLAARANYQGRPAERVTLTPVLLNDARLVAFMVSGESKAEALAGVLEGKRDPLRLPAQRIHPGKGRLLWLADREAAGGLQRS